MNIALVHNVYQQPGGEDQVFAAEGALLETHGHAVTRYSVHNDAVGAMGRLALARATVWNGEQYRNLRALFRQVRPDVVHVHNTLPLISPAVYDAAKAENATVVQTLHNYRLVCPSGLLFRNGSPCESCVGKVVPWPGVVHACYRGSRAATGVVTTMLTCHRIWGSYRRMVDCYIALTQFAKARFIEGGVPAEKIAVKPNFLPVDPGVGSGDGGYALFVGRLSEEKGLRVLLEGWQHVGNRLPLRIVGDGPLAGEVASLATTLEGVAVVGRLPPAAVTREMKGARVLIVPSVSYETFGLVAVEAFAVGTPVLASHQGALAEIVDHGRTGLHFVAGNASSLASVLRSVLDSPERIRAMRGAARMEYERKYSAETNYEQLMTLYRQAIES